MNEPVNADADANADTNSPTPSSLPPLPLWPHPSLSSRSDKRERKQTAQSLPPGITHNMMKKFVVYYREFINLKNGKRIPREYFKVESHPKLARPWVTSKSVKVPLLEKLKDANEYVMKLDDPSSATTGAVENGENGENGDTADANVSRFRLPKYTSMRVIRDTPTGTIYTMVYDRKDTMNGFRWTSSHTFMLSRDTDAVTETEIGKALQELRLKLREKYGADIIVI